MTVIFVRSKCHRHIVSGVLVAEESNERLEGGILEGDSLAFSTADDAGLPVALDDHSDDGSCDVCPCILDAPNVVIG